MTAATSVTDSAGFWDLDESLPNARRRAMRAAGVAGAWAIAGLPTALGWQRCALAAIAHVPCPGCGMTRAIELLALGQVGASLRMHPLAIPMFATAALFVVSTVWATAALGSPVRAHRSRLARAAIVLAVVVYTAAFVLWLIRWLGYFGGPVPVW